MKLKVTLRRSSGDRDLLVTTGAATTVGELARYLSLSDPARGSATDESAAEEMTIGVVNGTVRALDSRTPLADSPLRSGMTMSVLRAGRHFSEVHDEAVAMATVIQGPDVGTEFPLASGTNIVGRQRSCEVRLNDPMVSRTHARLNVSDQLEVIDLGSVNGVELNGSLITRETVRPTDQIRIGDTVLTVRLTSVPRAEGRAEWTSVGFIRSPRLAPQFVGQEFEAPELPQLTPSQPFPVLMIVAPLLMSGVLWLSTRQWQSLIFAALLPVMMLANWWEQRRQGRQTDARAVDAFRRDTDVLVREAEEVQEREGRTRRAEHPSSEECLHAVATRAPLMWTRRPDDWGFLEFRAGLGTCPSRSTVKPPSTKTGARELLGEFQGRVEHLTTVPDVPVVLRPRDDGGIGVAGPRSAVVAVARSFVVQAAALHSPAELAIALVTSQRSADDWQWLKWLPHCDAPTSPIGERHLAAAPAAAAALVGAIETLIDERSSDGVDVPKVPGLLLVIETDSPVGYGRLVELAERGWRVGVHVLWIAPEVAQLPAACRTFVDVRHIGQAGVGYVHDASLVVPVTTESVSHQDALKFAMRLSPLIDLGARNEDASDLPRSISFLAMEGFESVGDQPVAVIERWKQSHSIVTGPQAVEGVRKEGTLRAAVGHTAGHLHHVDLRADGPHALVGGTTGAGKSELLQTWILSMAASYSPQRLTFLLVDYKGGAAFADCKDLPHTVGMVTDLNPNGVQRALTSLAAELRYREEFLKEAGAKDLMDLEKSGAADAPPSLVIVVDEFAALVQDVPEFVDGVVNVAQRGRSLGLHLILATQRPAGVIKENLRANTNLRLALRVADEADSTDVLGSPDAAFFDPDLPGRAVSKTGPGRLLPFQTAYAGGVTGQGPAPIDIQVEELVLGPGIPWKLPDHANGQRQRTGGQTDISRVVQTIRAANLSAEIPVPRKPWLSELDAVIDIRTVLQPGAGPGSLVLGLLDAPEAQTQRPVAFEPDRHGNLAIYGAGGAGKSTAMRTLAVAAGLAFRQEATWVYGLDFGSGGLAMLEGLPHVGSVIPGADGERVQRLLRWLADAVEDRTRRFNEVNVDSIVQFRAASRTVEEPRVLVLLDGISAFLKAYEADSTWIDRLVDIAAKGRPLGIHLVVSGDRAGAVPPQLAATVQRRLVMRMASSEEYAALGAPAAMLDSAALPGRGIWEGHEVQCAVLGRAAEVGAQAAETQNMGRWMATQAVPAAPAIRRLPELLPLSALSRSVGDGVVIAMSDETLGPLTIRPEGTFVVAGPPGSGRTTGLLSIASAVRRQHAGARLSLLTLDRRSALARTALMSDTAVGWEEGQSLANELRTLFETEVDTPHVVVIEHVSEWAGSVAETSLELMVKSATRAGAFVLTDGDASSFGRPFGLESVVNASRVGFALQPDSGDGSGFGVTLPLRINKSQFPPGRGFLLQRGRHVLAQLCFPDAS